PGGEAEDYWLRGYVKFAAYDVTSDGLVTDCRTARDSFGAIGRFFDETGTRFGKAESLGDYLAELADQLERGQAAGVVTFNGRLFWEGPPPARPKYRADEPLPAPDEHLPELDLSLSPGDLLHVSHLEGHEELGALIATLPFEQVAEAVAEAAAQTGGRNRSQRLPGGRSSPGRVGAGCGPAAAHPDQPARPATAQRACAGRRRRGQYSQVGRGANGPRDLGVPLQVRV
ncbi:hypothetical protein GTW71_02645, partial [Streptomyces sp. SID6041]|nr:hypothetical protein [Streptomyces sp. SID6041]